MTAVVGAIRWARGLDRAIVGMTAALAGLVVICALLLMWWSAEHAKWVAWCEGQGGRVADHTNVSTGIGYAPDGKGGGSVVTTTSTSTTYYCLSATGGILDIR